MVLIEFSFISQNIELNSIEFLILNNGSALSEIIPFSNNRESINNENSKDRIKNGQLIGKGSLKMQLDWTNNSKLNFNI